MGEPFFKMRDLCRREGVRVFSSNYALYGDMSARLNAIYRQNARDVEVYSIDESFLDLSDVEPARRMELARDLRSTVLCWTGIPTCVGIGPTKTLAKLANHVAKTRPHLKGVCDLSDERQRDAWMQRVEPEDIWGVGPAGAAKLRAMGCRTVADVRDFNPRAVRGAITVVGERIIHELNGVACLDLETVAPTRKGCAVTRMFSSRVTERALMEQAVAAHASRLAEKIRREGLGTDHLTIFFHTSEYDRGSPQRAPTLTVDLPEATNDTLALVRAATWAVRRLWRDGYRYSKAGVISDDLVPLATSQRALPHLGQFDRERAAQLTAALDACNRRFGRGAVVTAASGMPAQRRWSTRFDLRSPRYTTRAEEVMAVKAA